MAKAKKATATADQGSGSGDQQAAQDAPGRARGYAILVALGAAQTLWAAFLWSELLVARMGGTPFCAVGEGMDCGSLWDGSFATAVHGATGMPLAGWGVVYGITSLVLPLLVLYRAAERSSAPALSTGVRLTAIGGVAAIAVFGAVSAAAGIICLGCIGTYLLVLAYAGVALGLLKREGFPDPGGGVGVAFATTIVAFLALLYPGLSTPKNLTAEAQKALAAATAGHSDEHKKPSTTGPTAPPTKTTPRPPADVDGGQRVAAFFSSLNPQVLQGISDSLHIYRTSPVVPKRPARATMGDASAKVQITDFTDVRCGHCAQLHVTLKEIHKAIAPDGFGLEARHFPLDGHCNPGIERKSPDRVNCLAAKMQICLEGNEGAFDFASALFENQQSLSPDKVYQMATKYMSRAPLDACINDPTTAKKLADDIQYAMDHQLDGTPLVLINGKKATGFGPFLFAMILLDGDSEHDVWKRLPPANPNAHMH